MWIGFVAFLVKDVVKCTVEISNYQFVRAISCIDYGMCSFPKFWTVLRWCVDCQYVKCALVREGDSKEECVIASMVVYIGNLTAFVSFEEN